METLAQHAKAYAVNRRGRTPLHSAMDSLNYFLAASLLMVAFLFWGPTDFFIRPTYPPNEIWLALTWNGVELWDLLFPVAAVFLFLATAFYRKLGTAHAFAALTWGSIGLLCSIHGIVFPPTEFFAFGIMALFCSVIHVIAIRLWSAERTG